jgi:hypothetical protein
LLFSLLRIFMERCFKLSIKLYLLIKKIKIKIIIK